MFSKSHLKIVAVATLGTLGLVQSSNASLLVDLRFPAGPNSPDAHSYNIQSPGNLAPITIEAWAVATGTTGNSAEEGLQSVILALKSAIGTAGITGSITSASRATGWDGAGSFFGTTSSLSTDGIGDWGNVTNPLSVNTTYFRARTTKSTNNPVDWGDNASPVGSVHNSLADGGDEFLVGTFTFTPTAAALDSVLKYLPVSPTGGTTAPAGWYEDTADKTAGVPTGSKSNVSGVFGPVTPNAAGVGAVTITVLPEPTTLGLAGLMGMGLLRRKRA